MTDFTFHIDAYTPQTIPMARLANYMAELAKLLGSPESVHFEAVMPGSVRLLATIDEPARAPIRKRLGEDRPYDPEVQRSIDELDGMLAKDDASGELTIQGSEEEDRVVIPFPGKNRPAEIDFGPIRQDGVLQGKIMRVGGRDETKHILLKDGDRFYSECVANIDTAQELGRYLFGPTVRLTGQGTWHRQNGEWELKSFRVHSFEVLEETPLDDLVTKLRAVPGNQWHEVDDPVATVLNERGQDDPS